MNLHWKISVALLILAVTMRDAATADKEKPKAEWGKEVAGCRFRIEPARASFPADQAVRLKMTLENVGDGLVYVPHSSTLQGMFRYEVRLPNGEPAPLTRYGNKEFGRNLVFPRIISENATYLEAGQSETDTCPALNRIYDMTERGEYQVTIYRFIYPKGAKPAKVPSNTLKIRIFEGPEIPDSSAEQPNEE